MDVTVAICTWNRAALLDQTLARFRELRVPGGVAWELIVVENNCTDNTSAVLAKYAGLLPLWAVSEPTQGHSHARNRAVAEAKAPLILWTDDDVLVHPDWLAEYLAAAQRFPDAEFFAGPVRPWFERSPPAWVPRHLARLGSWWALVDHGPDVRRLTPTEYGYGANLGFRASVHAKHPFDPAFGRVGKQLTSGDETRVIDLVRAAGGYGVWVGTAPVDHFLPANRLTPKYVAEISRWFAFQDPGPFLADSSPRFRGAPRWVWRRYCVAKLLTAWYSFAKGSAWVDALLDSARWRGVLDRFRAEGRP